MFQENYDIYWPKIEKFLKFDEISSEIKKDNSLVLSCEDEDCNYKINIRAEKKMKLIGKHNEEGKDAELIEKFFSNHFLLKLLGKPAYMK